MKMKDLGRPNVFDERSVKWPCTKNNQQEHQPPSTNNMQRGVEARVVKWR